MAAASNTLAASICSWQAGWR